MSCQNPYHTKTMTTRPVAKRRVCQYAFASTCTHSGSCRFWYACRNFFKEWFKGFMMRCLKSKERKSAKRNAPRQRSRPLQAGCARTAFDIPLKETGAPEEGLRRERAFRTLLALRRRHSRAGWSEHRERRRISGLRLRSEI